MNRRDLLKAIAAAPFASALGRTYGELQSAREKGAGIRTLQIWLEGAFAVVLQKGNPDRLVAFVPRAESGQKELEHDFFFNDPYDPKPRLLKDPAGYEFELSANGLKTYPEPYINPGFADFLATTQRWKLPPRVVTITLPFPNSINFGGRPLNVIFKTKRRGIMPTNHLLEYYVDDPAQVRMTCHNLGGDCKPSQNCPPGMIRFFFGAAPPLQSDEEQREHAVKFFNFMLRTSFPDLVKRYSLAEIESARQRPGYAKPMAMPGAQAGSLRSLVLDQDDPQPRFRQISETVDCQTGGILVRTASNPLG